MATLGTAKKVVNHVKSSLAVVTSSGSVVANMLCTRSIHGRLVEVHAIAGRGLRGIVTPSMARL